MEFFESLGFQLPKRKGVADVLQEVTPRKDQGQYWEDTFEPHSYVTVEEFANEFKVYQVSYEVGNYLATPFNRSKLHPNTSI